MNDFKEFREIKEINEADTNPNFQLSIFNFLGRAAPNFAFYILNFEFEKAVTFFGAGSLTK